MPAINRSLSLVQAYFHPPHAPKSSGGLPLLKQLYGFERVTLKPGASTVRV